MNQRSSPAPGKGEELDNDFGESNSSTITPKKPKTINHLSTLQEIAVKWVDRRCYPTLDRALRALVIGDL